MFFIVRVFFKLAILAVLSVAAIFAYTQYAKTYGIVKFSSGGYISFDAPKGTYIVEQSSTLARLGNGSQNYVSPASIEKIACDIDCVMNEQSGGLASVKSLDIARVPGNCHRGRNVTSLFSLSKPALACSVKIGTSASLSVLFEVAPGKVAALIMGTSSQVASHKPSFITENKFYVSEVVNSATYKENIWPSFYWLKSFN